MILISNLPFTGDTISNTCSSQGGDHQEREQNVRYTRASIIMVVMYFFCHAPRLLPCTAEIFMERKDMPPVRHFNCFGAWFKSKGHKKYCLLFQWLELMISVNHLLVVTNSSFNFLIYLMASKSQNSQNCKYLCQFYVKLKFSVFGRGVANNEILVGHGHWATSK